MVDIGPIFSQKVPYVSKISQTGQKESNINQKDPTLL